MPVPPATPEQLEDTRARVREWVARSLPEPPGFRLPQNVLMVSSDEQLAWLRDWQRRCYEAGLVGAEWPEAYGGGGQPRGTQRVIDRELSRAGAPFLVNNVALAWAGPIILHHGSEAQKQRYLRPLLACEEIWCQGFSEPDAGSDLASLRTRAERRGDGYVVAGHKVWTSLGQFADFMILLARTDPEAVKHAGISYFLFPMRSPGVEVRPLIKLTGEGGFNQVIFDEVRIPADALLGREGEGWKLAMATLSFERGASEGSAGASDMGGCDVSDLVTLVSDLGDDVRRDPCVRDRVAAFAIEAAALRHSARRARVPGLTAERPLALPLMAKLAGTEHAQRLADFGCEFLGYAGSLDRGDPAARGDGVWQRAYLNSYAGTIAGGTSEVLRNILGERVLGLPKSR